MPGSNPSRIPPIGLMGAAMVLGCATGGPVSLPGADPTPPQDSERPTGWPDSGRPGEAGAPGTILRFGALLGPDAWAPMEAALAAEARQWLFPWPETTHRPCDPGCGVAWRLPGMPAEAAFFLALEDWLRHGASPRVQAQQRGLRDGPGSLMMQAVRMLVSAEVAPGVRCEGQVREFRDEDRPTFNPAVEAESRLGIRRSGIAPGDPGGGEFLMEMGPALEDPEDRSVGGGASFVLRMVRTWEEETGPAEGRMLGVSLRCTGDRPLFASAIQGFDAFLAEVWGAPALCLCPSLP